MCQDDEHVPPINSKGRVFGGKVTNNFFLYFSSKKKLLMALFMKTVSFVARPEFNLRSPSDLIFNDLAERKSNSGLAPKRNVFVKNGIKTFCLYIR